MIDQMPPAATPRPRNGDELPQGVAIGTFVHPQFEALHAACEDLWVAPPAVHDSVVYGGRRAGTLKAPDGTLIEVIAM